MRLKERAVQAVVKELERQARAAHVLKPYVHIEDPHDAALDGFFDLTKIVDAVALVAGLSLDGETDDRQDDILQIE